MLKLLSDFSEFMSNPVDMPYIWAFTLMGMILYGFVAIFTLSDLVGYAKQKRAQSTEVSAVPSGSLVFGIVGILIASIFWPITITMIKIKEFLDAPINR